MRQLKIKLATPAETEELMGWLRASKNGNFDGRITGYPTLSVLASYDMMENIAYLPVHNVLMMETIGRNPQATELQSAQALRDLVKGAELVASHRKCAEVWMEATDPDVQNIAMNHGFTLLENPVLKLRL